MLLLLLISLYTSRVVLQVLGVDDYGIYNVVCGVVVMFSFINGALTTGTQRHISYELGKEDKDIAKIFSACLKTHIFLAGIIFIAAETIGLWFVNTQMNFPEGRMFAVNSVYQIAIFSTIIGIVKTPYEASVISYERMDFYAYVGIVEAVLKLLMAVCLQYIATDKLILFSFLTLLISFAVIISFVIFVHSRFKEVKLIKIKDRNIYKYIVSFSGWTLFGALGNMLETQGLNIVINIAWGVALNAAAGIANQVRGAMFQFVSGFQSALSPQLVMSESSGNDIRQIDLIYRASRYSFYLVLVMTIPLLANLSYILDLWLDKVPNFAVQMCFMMIIISILECLSYPLYTTIFAVGKIKSYQIAIAIIRISSLLVAIVMSKMGIPAFLIYLAPIISALTILLYRIIYLKKLKGISIYRYFICVLLNIAIVSFITCIPVLLYKFSFSEVRTVSCLIIETAAILIWAVIIVMLFGVKKDERVSILTYMRKR